MTKGFCLVAVVVSLITVAGCDARLDPSIGRTPRPPITVPAGDFTVVAVNDTLMPHATINSRTVYTLVTGAFTMTADSNWHFSTVESLSSTSGNFIGTSPANYEGTWTVADTTIVLLPSKYGTATISGDTVFWRNGPRHGWEDSIKFTLVRK